MSGPLARFSAPEDRPEFMACISTTGKRNDPVYCGRDAHGEFYFIDLDHARLTVASGDYLIPCPDCLEAAGQPVFAAEMLAEALADEVPG